MAGAAWAPWAFRSGRWWVARWAAAWAAAWVAQWITEDGAALRGGSPAWLKVRAVLTTPDGRALADEFVLQS